MFNHIREESAQKMTCAYGARKVVFSRDTYVKQGRSHKKSNTLVTDRTIGHVLTLLNTYIRYFKTYCQLLILRLIVYVYFTTTYIEAENPGTISLRRVSTATRNRIDYEIGSCRYRGTSFGKYIYYA